MKKPLLLGIILTVCVVIVAFVFSLGYPGGMISYWKFDEGEGTIANDTVDANDGALVNGPLWTTAGMVNGALSFDGVNDFVDLGTTDVFDGWQYLTIEFWAKPEQTSETWPSVIAKWGGTSYYEAPWVGIHSPSGVWSWEITTDLNENIYRYSSVLVDYGEWQHITCVFDISSQQVEIYKNGSLEETWTGTYVGTSIISNTNTWSIGRVTRGTWGSHYFNGIIDEVAIYNRALSAGEIQQHYENGSYEVACVPPPDNMVSWWPGDANANDIVDGNDGTEYGATFAAGMVGQAFSFDGVDDYVEVPDADNLDMTNELTIDAWFYNKGKIDPGMRWQRIIHKNYRKNYEMWIDDSNRKLSFRIGNESGNIAILSSGTTIQFDIWYHVAAVYDGSSMKLYLNGDLSNSMTTTIAPLGITTDPVIIGNVGTDISSFNHNRPFKGLIDEVEIFSRALSQEEIQAIYFAGSAGKCKVIEVDIDIKPESDPNCFNIDGHGNIPVAILGSADFDVLDIDFSTLSFEGMAVRVRGKRGPMCSFEDSNGDSILDLVCHFEDNPEYWTGGDTTAKVTGELSDGKRFEGTDSICIVKIVE